MENRDYKEQKTRCLFSRAYVITKAAVLFTIAVFVSKWRREQKPL